MKTIAILSLSLTAISTVLAAPAAQYEDPPALYSGPVTGPIDKWAFHVDSVAGNPRLFKNRPIVPLTESTIDGVPQNHAPPAQVHLPPSFGMENFTVHPPSKPVIINLSKIGDQEDSRYSLTGVYPNDTNWREINFVAQYSLPAPNAFIAMGWFTAFSERACPEGLLCDMLNWDIHEDDEERILRPRGKTGAWDAVKTREGRGWRVVWKVDAATVHHEVKILVVPFEK